MRTLLSFFCISAFFPSCTWEKLDPYNKDSGYNGYPKEIANIMLTRCATPGCHNDKSYQAAGGLNLISWDKLFEGYGNNAAVIPYSSRLSTLVYYINSFPDIGLTLTPLMPLGGTPLSRDEVQLVKIWIDNGAYNENGFVKFSDNPNRRKIYLTNQGCDLVTVFDAETKLAMRYVNVGATPAVEAPHNVKVSPDKKNWYVVFIGGTKFQKFDASTDNLITSLDIGSGNWNTFAISSDSKTAYIVDWSSNGTIVIADLATMTEKQRYQGAGVLSEPHGSYINKANTTLYITAQKGNFIYKIDVKNINNPEFNQVLLAAGEQPNNTSKYDPHEIVFTPDENYYFLTCQKSNEVRAFNASNDNLVAVIPVGVYPQEMAISANKDYLFVTCSDDNLSFPGKQGSVAIINYKTFALVKKIYTGTQPHGIAVDENSGKVLVAHRNITASGPAPHHAALCSGRNGNVTAIDINTLELVEGFNVEVSVDPYSLAVR